MTEPLDGPVYPYFPTLFEVLDDLGPDQPAIVFCENDARVNEIVRALHDRAIPSRRVTSTTGSINRALAVKEFNDGEVNLLVVPFWFDYGWFTRRSDCRLVFADLLPDNPAQRRQRQARIRPA